MNKTYGTWTDYSPIQFALSLYKEIDCQKYSIIIKGVLPHAPPKALCCDQPPRITVSKLYDLFYFIMIVTSSPSRLDPGLFRTMTSISISKISAHRAKYLELIAPSLISWDFRLFKS